MFYLFNNTELVSMRSRRELCLALLVLSGLFLVESRIGYEIGMQLLADFKLVAAAPTFRLSRRNLQGKGRTAQAHHRSESALSLLLVVRRPTRNEFACVAHLTKTEEKKKLAVLELSSPRGGAVVFVVVFVVGQRRRRRASFDCEHDCSPGCLPACCSSGGRQV